MDVGKGIGRGLNQLFIFIIVIIFVVGASIIMMLNDVYKTTHHTEPERVEVQQDGTKVGNTPDKIKRFGE